MKMRKLKKYKPTKFKAKDSVYDKDAADFAVNFIQCLCHTKGTWAGKREDCGTAGPGLDNLLLSGFIHRIYFL